MKTIKKLNLFFSTNLKESIKYFKKTKNFIIFSSFLFSIFILIGYFLPIFFEKEISELIKTLIEETEGLGFFELIFFIFKNNIQSAFFSILLGIIFGIFPITTIIINGYVLGFVADKSVSSEGILILWKLLPHGIFEIPAIIISVGLGIKLGIFLFIYFKKNKGKEFSSWLIDSLRVFIFIIIPLLILAAVIEGSLIYFLK